VVELATNEKEPEKHLQGGPSVGMESDDHQP